MVGNVTFSAVLIELLDFRDPQSLRLVVLLSPMATTSATPFDCPNCGARYNVVRMESHKVDLDNQITCRSCGGPLQGREGKYILKYFLVSGRRMRAMKLSSR
jgi:predicted RNA-binding Zn-ribbon protein involved in translation (DUF1610 family)